MKTGFRKKVVASTALALTLMSGYARRSYAACVNTGGTNYLCSGANAVTQSLLNKHTAHVTTDPGFSVNAAAGDAIRITGDGDLSFTDINHSAITGANNGLTVYSDFGSVNIDVNGDIAGGGSGIHVYAYDLTDTHIDVKGSVYGSGFAGILNLVYYGGGSFNLNVSGDVSGLYGGVGVVSSYGQDVTITTTAGSSVSGSLYAGIFVDNGYNHPGYNGSVGITIGGDVFSSGAYGSIAARNGALGGVNLTIENTGNVIGTGNTGASLWNKGSGGLSFTNHGTLSGDTGLYIWNIGTGVSTGIVTDGTIEGTGGRAIYMRYAAGYGGARQITPIEIAGGRIIGDVFDNALALDATPVTVTGDFTSEGNFTVSDFDVDAAGDFTLGAGNAITLNAGNTLGVAGRFAVGGAGGSLSGNMNVAGGNFDVDDDFTVSGDFANNGTTTIATGKTLTVDTMSAGTGHLWFGFNTLANHALLSVTTGGADLTGQTLHVDVTGVTGLTAGQQALLVTGIAPHHRRARPRARAGRRYLRPVGF